MSQISAPGAADSRPFHVFKISLLALLFALTGITQADNSQSTSTETGVATPGPAPLKPAQQRLSEALAKAPAWLQNVYRDTDYQYYWSTSSNDSETRARLLAFIESRIDENRLNANDYDLGALKNSDALNREEREILGASIYAKLAQDLLEGRMSAQIDIPDDYDAARDLSREQILLRAYQHGAPMDYLLLQTPDNFLVEGLLAALKRYQQYHELGGWERVEMSEPKIELGMSSEGVPLIRKRLMAEGFLERQVAQEILGQVQAEPAQSDAEPTIDPNVFTEADAEAVEKFQRSRAILSDGIVGSGTLAAMNEPLDDLLQRLHINIERARWLPSKLGDRSVLVNIADYQVRMYDGETLVDSIKVIVGKDHTRTPVFADTMERVVINPYWNIPNSIVCCEIAPKMLENPNHLKEKNMEVLSGWGVDAPVIDESTVDWEAATRGEIGFRVRQRPGPENSLGLIKFLFPNEYAVYLHDTPADSLFDRDKRAFSHGCIRLEKPVEFADFVFQNQDGWNGSKVTAQIETGQRTVVELAEELPVYIGYFTAWSDPDGEVSFARDIYERDERIIAGLKLTQ